MPSPRPCFLSRSRSIVPFALGLLLLLSTLRLSAESLEEFLQPHVGFQDVALHCFACDPREDFSGFDFIAVVGGGLDLRLDIKPPKNRVGDLNARQHQILFGQKTADTTRGTANRRARSNVAAS